MLLSNYLLDCSPSNVVGGGFIGATNVRSTNPNIDVSSLSTNLEEDDTSLILHCHHAHFQTIVVSVSETDVGLLILLLTHIDKVQVDEQAWDYLLFMQVQAVIVSQFSFHGEKTFGKCFKNITIGLGKGLLTETTFVLAKKMCKIYGICEVNFFCIGRAQETLPPMSDAVAAIFNFPWLLKNIFFFKLSIVGAV